MIVAFIWTSSSFFYVISNGTPAIFGTEKLPGADVTDRSALRTTLHGHTLPSTSVVILVFIGTVKVDGNVSSSSPSQDLATCVRQSTTHATTRL